jgi:hypothetical protein
MSTSDFKRVNWLSSGLNVRMCALRSMVGWLFIGEFPSACMIQEEAVEHTTHFDLPLTLLIHMKRITSSNDCVDIRRQLCFLDNILCKVTRPRAFSQL